MAARAAEQHQAAQHGLVLLLARELAQVWKLLDISRLSRTLPAFIAAIAQLVQQYGAAAGAIAADFYTAERRAARVTGTFIPTPTEPPNLSEVTDNIRWATKGLWSTEPDETAAKTLTAGAVEKLVLDVGRDTITNAVHDDAEAIAWAREVEPSACYFCLMLATRGAVYTSKESAGPNVRGNRNKRRGVAFEGEGEFKVHDHCRCHAVPVFTEYEPTAEIRNATKLWESATAGKSGRDAINAFRQAVEGRTK